MPSGSRVEGCKGYLHTRFATTAGFVTFLGKEVYIACSWGDSSAGVPEYLSESVLP